MISNVAPWLASSRWSTVPIRRVARLGSGHTPSRQHPEYWENCTIPWVTLADVWQLRDAGLSVISETRECVSPLGVARSAAVRHPAGTVILSRTASVGFSAILGKDMATSQDFATWTCGARLLPEYLLYALRAMAPDLRRLSTGSTHKTIYMPDIEQLQVPLPGLTEQRRIADLLAAQTDQIDQLVAHRRLQVELFKLRTFAGVFQAIRGSRVLGPRKRSGLSWLGHVPFDWPVATVSSQYEVLLGKMLNPERLQGASLRPYLRNTNVQWDRIDIGNLFRMDFPASERSRYRVLPGDLLVCEGGQPGRAAIWRGETDEVYYQKALHRVRERGYSSTRWLYYCLRVATALNVFAVEGNQTTIAHLTCEQLRAHRFPFPSREMQDRLIEDLDEMQAAEREFTSYADRQVELLEERRRALIVAAVTGQMDVAMARGVDVS